MAQDAASSIKQAIRVTSRSPEVAPQLSAPSRARFNKFAVKDAESGELYLGADEFLAAIAPPDEDYRKIDRQQYAILFSVADAKRTGKITLAEWGVFENLLMKPDAEYEIAFRLFDVERAGRVQYDHFRALYELNKGPDSIPFDWECEWAKLYIGSNKNRQTMDYPEFSQMVRGLQGERIRQAFQLFDKNRDGFIEPEDFARIIRETAKHKLSDHLLQNLQTVCNISNGSKISYAHVRAFQNLIKEMDLVELVVRRACAKSKDGKITRTEFLHTANKITRFSLFTPMEANILFHFASLAEPSGKLGLVDFAKVLDPAWRDPADDSLQRGTASSKTSAVPTTKIWSKILASAHHFGLGSMAGAFGALMVYPIDLVKTRLQNQRGVRPGERLYKNSIDCFQKVVRTEGFRGLYSGVLPQLIGVAPEKAIKLTVNDLVRHTLADKNTGSLSIGQELLAGSCAGASQVIFTNPLEIIKIRLQVQGQVVKTLDGPTKRSAIWIIKNLGLAGLYKGASACLLRDVPFSAIYFTTYSHLKKDLFGESAGHKLNVVQLLIAGAIAGMPAAYLTTPCDVIKTRLQVEAKKGESSYTGLRHAAKTIWREEGFKAFYKGGPARIMRSSPQFGFTLAAYELLQGLVPVPGPKKNDAEQDQVAKLVGSSGSSSRGPVNLADRNPYNRSRNALKILLDINEDFGKLRFPDEAGWKTLPAVIGGGAGSLLFSRRG